MPIYKEISAKETGGVPVKIWTDRVEEGAEAQLKTLAGMAHVVGHVAAMPDVHPGVGATVGSVFATRGALLPAAVGVDIGCGLLAQPFDVRAVDLSPAFLRELHALVKRQIPTGPAKHPDAQDWEGFADEGRFTPAVAPIVRDRGPWQLGSLGGGNHFIELCREAAAGADARVWLLIHSGSRGAGAGIAEYHIGVARDLAARDGREEPPGLWPLLLDSQEGRDYLRDMRWAQDFAAENRERMRWDFTQLLGNLLKKRLRIGLSFDPAACINIHHNYAEREEAFGEALWVHRKGATFAGVGAPGIIPGSMATGSYIVRGRGNSESLRSCSHGAGRSMSRGQAPRSISEESFAREMDGIVAETGRAYLDEAPQAYKDLDTVIADQADLVEPVARLLPLMNVKGAGRAGRDRTRDKADPVGRRRLARRRGKA